MAKDKGFEYLDDTPVEVPVKLRRASTDAWAEMVKRVVEQVSEQARSKGGESFEESLDFGPDEDEELPISPSEMRYLREEELLTDALEASRVRSERRRAARKLKEMKRGNESRQAGEGKGAGSEADEGRDGSGAAGSADAGKKPEAKGG